MSKQNDEKPRASSTHDREQDFVRWVQDRETKVHPSLRYALLGIGLLLSLLWVALHYHR
jgi:hypothetical protein